MVVIMVNKRIFCIPFAGGVAEYYAAWNTKLSNTTDIQVVPIELAGKGTRKFEDLYNSMDEAIEDVYSCISSQIDENPYAIFGHSMGSIIAFEVCKLLEQRSKNGPVHLFCSGRQAPHIVFNTRYSDLDDKALKEHIMNFQYFNSKNNKIYKVLGLYLEEIRNDFRIVDEYRCCGQEKLKAAITVFCGKDDMFEIENLNSWELYTDEFDSHIFSGGHFYINDHYQEVIKIIIDKMNIKKFVKK